MTPEGGFFIRFAHGKIATQEAAMPHDSDQPRAREIADAWRSSGAHALARALVLVAREEGAEEKLQRAIAEAVIEIEEPATEEDLAHALRE